VVCAQVLGMVHARGQQTLEDKRTQYKNDMMELMDVQNTLDQVCPKGIRYCTDRRDRRGASRVDVGLCVRIARVWCRVGCSNY